MLVYSKTIESIYRSFDKIDKVAKKIEEPGKVFDTQDVVTLIQSEHQVKANAKVIQTQDEMTKTLIDITA